MPREGMLIQVDGSHHRWLGDHGPPFALLLAVDDATGIVVNALCEQENTRDYFLLMRGLIQRHGIPMRSRPALLDLGAPTQFSRAIGQARPVVDAGVDGSEIAALAGVELACSHVDVLRFDL